MPSQPEKPFHFSKNSFGSGEFSPAMSTRNDLAKFVAGAKLLRNFTVVPTGGAKSVPGTHYRATAKYDNKKVRMIPFEFSSSQRYAIEAGEDYFRFYTNGGQIATGVVTAWSNATAYVIGDLASLAGINYYCILGHTNHTPANATYWYPLTGTIYEIPTIYDEVDLFDLRWAQSADILFIVNPLYPPQMLQRKGNTDWVLAAYPFIDGPFMLENTDAASTITPSATTGAGITLTAAKSIFNALHVNALWQIKHDIAGQDVTTAFGSVVAGSSIKCGGTWRLITHGTWTGTIAVEKSLDGGSTWKNIRSFSSVNDNNVNTFGTEVNDSGNQFLVRINMTAYTSGTCNADLSADAFTQTGVVKITAVGGATSATATVLTTLGDTTATADWSEGSWSDYRGYPSVVVFDQDRLVFASTVTEPSTYWMTQVSNYYSFARSNPLLDTDGISSPLPARQLNEINDLIPSGGLVGFTSSGEWAIGDPTLGPISPSTIANKLNSSYGSDNVTPVAVGKRIIYVQSSGQVIRDLAYQYFYNYFDGTKISIFADHLFLNHSIKEMHFQLDPDSIIWMIRDDGQLIALTHLYEQEVVAFTHRDTRDGLDKFESMCIIQGVGYKEVWCAVQRGTKRYIEQFDQRGLSTAPEDQFFVDCGITYSGQSQKVITGLDHLEGKKVAILADGCVVANYDTPYTVIGGQITLPAAASKVHIGIPIVNDLETLNFEVPTPTGTAQGKKAFISRLTMNVEITRGGYLGPDFDHLFEVKSIVRSTYGTALPLYTGEVKEVLGGGYQNGGRICYRQKDPLPVTILGFVPIITIGDMSTLL